VESFTTRSADRDQVFGAVGSNRAAAGNIYLILGNGTFDTSLDASGFPSLGDCGNCYVKISSTSSLRPLDYFTPLNTVAESAADQDFGSGTALLLPDLTDATHHLTIGSGKDANSCVLEPRQNEQVQPQPG